MKTYLVTGGAGFIGSNYIHYHMKNHGQDIKVINLDALTYCARRSNVGMYEESKRYSFIHGNICDEELVKSIFTANDIDYVVHFAAQTHVDRSIASANEFAKTNVIGTLNLLNAAKDAWEGTGFKDKRFLYVSTDEVYGELGSEGYFTENSPLLPRNPYSATKASGDMLTRAFFITHRLPVAVTRCTNNYGPYQFEEKFIPHCIKKCLSGEEIPVYGDGMHIRDWLYVEDHCRAIDMVLHKGLPGEVYNIGGNNEYPNIELVSIIRRLLKDEYLVKVPDVRFVEDRKGHDRRYAIDSSKLRHELGWKPEVTFKDGIRRTVGWYMEHKDYINIV